MSDYTPPTLVTPTPGGSAGDGSMNGALTLQSQASDTAAVDLILESTTNRAILKQDSEGNIILDSPTRGTVILGPNSNISISNNIVNFGGRILDYSGILTVGKGVAPLYGDDARTGLTAADSAAKTLYTTTAAGQLYRLMGRILATAGTSPSATYTIKWTEGGATITKTLTISALDSDSDLSVLIQPDSATAITAQLTAISGTGTTVNVAATVEQMA